MIEVFRNDVFDVEILFGEPCDNMYILCSIVDDKYEGDVLDRFEFLKGGSTSFVKTLSAKDLTPSKNFAPHKHYIRVAIKELESEKESTIYQEELYVKEIYQMPITVVEG